MTYDLDKTNTQIACLFFILVRCESGQLNAV